MKQAFLLLILLIPCNVFAQKNTGGQLYIFRNELAQLNCSPTIKIDYLNKSVTYYPCYFGNKEQQKKYKSLTIDISNLSITKAFVETITMDKFIWLNGSSNYKQKKYNCKRHTSYDYLIKIVENDKETKSYGFEEIYNCEGESPFNFVDKMNKFFKELEKLYPQY
jgi:hypothetical protein